MRHSNHCRNRIYMSVTMGVFFIFSSAIVTAYATQNCGKDKDEETNIEVKQEFVAASGCALYAGISKALYEAQDIVITLPSAKEPVEVEQVTIQEENTLEKETITEEDNGNQVVRENTLYYIDDEGFRYNCPYEYQDYLWELCKEKGMEEYYELFIAQMYHESAFNASIQSSTNDSGIMQINECNHEWLSEIIGDDDFLNPYTNMDAGVYLMSTYLKKYQDVHKALVCYNMGEGKVIYDDIYESEYSRGVVADMAKLVAIE